MQTTQIAMVAAVVIIFLLFNVSLIFSLFSKDDLKSNLRKTHRQAVNTSKDIKVLLKSEMSLPNILYGTAWKKERTAELVYLALQKGFRGIDTACQPKHYNEAGVGAGVKRAYDEGLLTRSDLFLQTKFTSIDGQDPNNIPYDSDALLEDQVGQSFRKSCENLHTDYLDSLILHSPMKTFEETLRVWKVFENFVRNGQVRIIGISNTYNLKTFKMLYEQASIKPSFLQNRFYQKSGYDIELRDFCKDKGVVYQSFWTLTANPNTINSDLVRSLARKYSQTKEQIFFRFIKSIGILPLSGTTSELHMTQDLEATAPDKFPLLTEEINAISAVLFA